MTAREQLSPYEQWMVKSNLATIRETGIAASEHIAILRANGYDRVADAVERHLKVAETTAGIEAVVHRHFVNGYIEAALWTSELLDEGLTADDLAPEAREEIERECAEFLAANRADLDAYFIEREWPRFGPNDVSTDRTIEACAGHDFWLTRNGHGAGFWDRGLGELGDRLSDAARAYGECCVYVGDDGQVYA